MRPKIDHGKNDQLSLWVKIVGAARAILARVINIAAFGRAIPRDKDNLGRYGEKLAGKTLKRLGMKILARNYRCPIGEIDIIALDCTSPFETICFVEVKTRSSNYLSPESAVNTTKQRKIRKVGQYYLAAKKAELFDARFDIVTVVVMPSEKPEITHIPNAFF